jgi:predicted nucleic acid-binding protein
VSSTSLVFIDTNILVYAHDQGEGAKHDIAVAALNKLWRNRTGVVSTQVLQEFYSVVTQKRPRKMSSAKARERMKAYSAWCSVNTTAELLVAASLLEEHHSVQWWDALIVAAALRSGASTLLSEDMQHGRKFGPLTIRNPFVEN